MTRTCNCGILELQQGGQPPSKYAGQEVERMEQDMTQAELIIFLETLAENVELKADTGEEAAKIIRDKIEQLK